MTIVTVYTYHAVYLRILPNIQLTYSNFLLSWVLVVLISTPATTAACATYVGFWHTYVYKCIIISCSKIIIKKQLYAIVHCKTIYLCNLQCHEVLPYFVSHNLPKSLCYFV